MLQIPFQYHVVCHGHYLEPPHVPLLCQQRDAFAGRNEILLQGLEIHRGLDADQEASCCYCWRKQFF